MAGNASSGWTVIRRQPASAVWGGYASSLTGAPARSGQVQPRATVPVPRRTPARGQWRGQSAPQPHVPGQAQPHPVIARRAAARAVVAGTVTHTTNATAPLPVPVHPPATAVSRRYPPRVIWRGSAVPGTRPQPATGGLVRRRAAARAWWRGTAPVTSNAPGAAVPPPRMRPRITPRAAARGQWQGSAPANVPVHRILISLGTPFTTWETGDPFTAWETGDPFTSD